MQRVHGHYRDHALRHPPRRLQGHRAAHGAADEHDALQTQLRDHGLDVLAEAANRPVLASLARLPVTGQVDRDHAMILGEDRDLVVPQFAVAAPAVDKHQRGIALAPDGVVDGDAVGGQDDRGQKH